MANGEMNADREHELEVLIRARYPIIYIVSWEERRVEESLRQVAARRKKKLYGWTVTKGVVSLDSLKPVGVDPTAKDPVQALEYVASSRDSAIFVLKDFHPFLDEMRSSPNNAVVARKLRDIATELKESRKTLVILSPVLQFPPELEKDITVLDYALPTLEELDQSLERVIRSARSQASVKQRTLKLSEEERERVLKAAQGLTCTEAENVFAKSLVMVGKLDLDIIVAEKKQIIRKSRILEYYESRENFDYVGGMAALKEWLRKRGLAFSERARHFGLPEPRGLLLLGVQGAGKSLLAKAVASQWQLPLLKLDMGRVFSELVGSSEQNMRTVLSTAESVAPCLDGESRITLADGSERAIRTLYEDPTLEELTVLGVDDDLEIVPVSVKAITRRPAPDLYEIRLMHGRLRATSNHLHPTLRDGEIVWRRTGELTPRDYVAVSMERIAFSPIGWSKVASVKPVKKPEYVYDLVCEDNHTFIANGIVTHNCILWLDELEKGLAGTASSHRSDAGTAARVFGSLLTWLQEKTSPVFTIATANDINLLPPEALRKGRFDEIFFIDLPDAEERREVFAIHLAKRGRDPQRFDLVTLSREAEGFSGAEIEQVVISGLYDAFESGQELETRDLRRNIADTVPLSQTMKTQIKALQDWACTHARPASIRK